MQINDLDFHFKDLFENTSDLIHYVRLDGTIKLANSAWLKALGYTYGEVIGKSVYEFLSPECREEYREKRQLALDTGFPQDLTTVFVARSGGTINVDGQIACILTEDGLRYTRGIFRDISIQRKTEKQLNATEGRVETFFKSAPDAVVIINQYDVILDWNPKAEEIFGFRAEEVLGKSLAETIIPDRYREAHLRGMQRFLISGEGPVLNKALQLSAQRKDGSELFVNISISSVDVEGGWLFIAFLSDISESRKLERELIKKEAELLHTRRLDEKKDEFLSIASHELKTPLTTVKAYTQIGLAVAEKNKLPVLAEYLRKADRHIDKLTYLINELLDVSKIQAGKLELVLVPVPFNEYLREIIDSLRQITPQNIDFEGCPPVYVNMDRVRMEQVITNMVSNASKFSPGQDRINISCSCTDNHIVVSVEDFGIGIAADKLEKIFGRFYRVEEIATGFSGLGIGLYIAAEIMKGHNGKIWAESVLGKGSIFRFSLPLMAEDKN